ncbi:MAG: Sua5/YciO/YrdC/YwlC family protein [Patescibacteria group bacterium]
MHLGGVLVAPTETLYEFVCDTTSRRAIDRVYKIKGREKNKFLPLAVASLA